LTTVGVPAGEIGRGAADYLINAVSGLTVPKSIQLPYRIIMRGSTGPVPPSSTRKTTKRPAVRKR
jgi:LacI family transcriptional regulator